MSDIPAHLDQLRYFCINSGGHFVQWSRTVCAILVESIIKNISMKLYSEKQLKDIKNFDFIPFRNIIFKQTFLSLMVLSLCNSPKCKWKFTGHWL